MTEIFENIDDKIKETAETIWRLAVAQKDPAKAAKFLNNTTNYYRSIYTEEEIEFLQFYLNMKMEMMKDE